MIRFQRLKENSEMTEALSVESEHEVFKMFASLKKKKKEKKSELPERQEASFIQNGSQSPLDLLIVNQLGSFQARVVGGETETRVQNFIHPGWLEALIPAGTRAE